MKALGLAPVTTAQLEDFISLMRRLWRGETIFGHDGPAGHYPFLRLDPSFDEDLPVAVTAFGPQTLALGGRACDHVVLHTFFTDETLVRCVQTVKEAAEAAGRDPDSVKVWSCFATIGDHLPEPLRLKKTVGRLATYLQAYGDLMIETNRWDPAVLARFRADPVVTAVPGAIDDVATTEQLEHIAALIPDEWLAPSAQGRPRPAPTRCAVSSRSAPTASSSTAPHPASPSSGCASGRDGALTHRAWHPVAAGGAGPPQSGSRRRRRELPRVESQPDVRRQPVEALLHELVELVRGRLPDASPPSAVRRPQRRLRSAREVEEQ